MTFKEAIDIARILNESDIDDMRKPYIANQLGKSFPGFIWILDCTPGGLFTVKEDK